MHSLVNSWLSQIMDKNGFTVRKCQRWVQYIYDMISCISKQFFQFLSKHFLSLWFQNCKNGMN